MQKKIFFRIRKKVFFSLFSNHCILIKCLKNIKKYWKKYITFKIIYLNFIGANKPHPITTTRKKVSGEIDGLISSKPSTSKCSSGYGSAEMPITPVMLNSGEHVAAVWFNDEKNKLQWYLGIASDTVNAMIL